MIMTRVIVVTGAGSGAMLAVSVLRMVMRCMFVFGVLRMAIIALGVIVPGVIVFRVLGAIVITFGMVMPCVFVVSVLRMVIIALGVIVP